MHKTKSSHGPRIDELRRALLRWYDRHQRDLPWRHRRDPYAIWLSEIMLQQTRVDVVIPYYERFLQRFPSVERLAAAPLDELLRAWAGLGYYSRARNLHAAARQIVEKHGGRFPEQVDDLRGLPGIGRYTAGAVGSIAFGQRLPIVDGNIIRVVARFLGHDQCIDTTESKARLWEWAASWADCRRPGDANQALMELGATICSPATPQCHSCPIVHMCEAHAHNKQDSIPVRRKRRDSQSTHLAALLLRKRGRLLLLRRQRGRLLQDFWEMPTVRITRPSASKARLEPALRQPLLQFMGLEVDSWKELGEARHGILHHRLRVRILEGFGARRLTGWRPVAEVARNTATANGGAGSASSMANLSELVETRWTTARECGAMALTTLADKTLKAAAAVDSTWQQYANHSPAKNATGKRRHEPARNHA